MRATRFSATMAAALLATTLGTTTMVFAQSNPPSPSEPAPNNGMMDDPGKMGRGPMMDMSQMNRMMENCNRMMEGAQHSPSHHDARPDNG